VLEENEYILTLDLVWRVGGWRATSEPQAPTSDVASSERGSLVPGGMFI
jgi:hypothetical protein